MSFKLMAVVTPTIAPAKCDSHEMPGSVGSTPEKIPPYTSRIPMEINNDVRSPLKNPYTIRKDERP
jgi:hypothetical protein